MRWTLGLLGLVLTWANPVLAEHGGTAGWQKQGAQLRESWKGKVRYQSLDVRWAEDGSAVFYKREDAEGWWKVAAATGEKVALVKLPEGAVKSLEKGKGGKGKSRPSRPRNRPTSPDKKWKAQVEEGQRVVLEGEEGVKKEIENSLPEGWVVDGRVMWSPKSDRFVVWRRPDHSLREVHYVRSSPKDQLQPEHFTNVYPKAGDDLNVGRPVICFVDGSTPMLMEEELVKNPYRISDHHWREDGARLTCEFVERGFGRFAVIEMNSSNRSQRVVAEEVSEVFIHVFDKSYRHDLKDGKEIIWRSERDGWSHLYLLDGATGQGKAQLTKGEWVVRSVVGVFEEKGEVLIRLSGYHSGQDPYWEHWARVGLGGGALKQGEMVLLTEGGGTHRLRFSPDREHYVDEWSSVDSPPVYELRRASDGGLVTLLEKADESELEKTTWSRPERFVAKDRHGKYDLHGVILRPPGFNPAKKYPVVEEIYAGPHGSFVPKSWRVWFGSSSEMAAEGFIVVRIDGLGTSNRSREFQQFAYKNLMDSGFPDRVKWMRAAAAKYPEMDLTRVGIYGGSAGGQSSLAGLLTHGDFYRAGVADCGCHDNRMDKIWWNEQWMDWPVGPHYAANSNVTHIDKLQGHLMLTVGEVDTNVDPSSTLQVVDALIKADKDFEFYLVPNGKHGIGESPYLRRKRVEFFRRHLGEAR
jgi:dipeptidyl-peptidase-4